MITKRIKTKHWLFLPNYQLHHATVTPNTPHCAKGSNSNNWFKFADFKLFADVNVASGTLQYAKLCFRSFGSERLLREYTFRLKRGCPAGTYEDTSVTSAFVDHCKPCPTGRYSTGGKKSEGDPLVCNGCARGKYGDVSIATSESHCQKCSPGRYGNVEGLTSNLCQDYEAGYYCPSTSLNTNPKVEPIVA